MAARDSAAIAGGVSEATLVDRAGGAVARGARHLLGGAYGRRVVVVCGKGNNGADGRIAGQRLADWGARVDRFDLASFERPRFDRSIGRADLAVDAMFGTGFRGPLEGDAAFAAEALSAAPCAVLAVDIPSGVDGLTGAVRGPAVEAEATVCLAALKPGLVFYPGAALAGAVEVAPIYSGTPRPPGGIDLRAATPVPGCSRGGRRRRLVTSAGARESQVVSGWSLRGWGFAGDDRSSHAGRTRRTAGRGRNRGGRPSR